MANRTSYTGFPTSHVPRFYAAPNFLKMGIKYLNLPFERYQYIARGTTFPLKSWLRLTPSRRQRVLSFCIVAPQRQQLAKKSSTMANRKSYTGFPRSHQPRFYAAPNFLKMGIKYINLSSFLQVSTIKDDKSAAKFHYIKISATKL